MVSTGRLMVASFATLLGIALGLAGVIMTLDAGSFGSSAYEQDNGILGIGGGSSQSASIDTPAWVGLFLAAMGASALLFGLRAMFASFEGRGQF